MRYWPGHDMASKEYDTGRNAGSENDSVALHARPIISPSRLTNAMVSRMHWIRWNITYTTDTAELPASRVIGGSYKHKFGRLATATQIGMANALTSMSRIAKNSKNW